MEGTTLLLRYLPVPRQISSLVSRLRGGEVNLSFRIATEVTVIGVNARHLDPTDVTQVTLVLWASPSKMSFLSTLETSSVEEWWPAPSFTKGSSSTLRRHFRGWISPWRFFPFPCSFCVCSFLLSLFHPLQSKVQESFVVSLLNFSLFLECFLPGFHINRDRFYRFYVLRLISTSL